MNQIESKPGGQGWRSGYVPNTTSVYVTSERYIGLSLPIEPQGTTLDLSTLKKE